MKYESRIETLNKLAKVHGKVETFIEFCDKFDSDAILLLVYSAMNKATMQGIMMARENNWKHPELQQDEELIMNVRETENWKNAVIHLYESVRLGNVAYTTGGKEIVPDMKPLFGKFKT